jgi:hypothetical protein
MDLDQIVKTVSTVAVPVAALIGVGGRKRRLRNDIRENLALVEALEKDDVLRDHTPAASWLQGKIVVDVAKLSDRALGTPKKPVPKMSVGIAAVLALIFGYWTYRIDADGFVWYSIFPGVASALFLISIFGMFTNRENAPDQSNPLPPGATPIRSDTAEEQIANSISLAASAGNLDERFAPHGQIGVVYEFISALSQGRFEDAISCADENWLKCRIQAWLWNNRDSYGHDEVELDALATSLLARREPDDVWDAFVEIERAAFGAVWSTYNPDAYGAASRRRRIARDYDLVILAPVGESGGYFVTTATALPEALTFVVHRDGDRWLVAHHSGTAPPTPGWPPAWWSTDDPAVDALP